MPRMKISKRSQPLPIYLLEAESGGDATSVDVDVDEEFRQRCEATQRAYNQMQRDLAERYHAPQEPRPFKVDIR